MAHPPDLIGVGWRFPITVDGRGGIAMTSGERDIEEAIRLILETPKGYRLMRPEFGCRIHELLYAPINTSTIVTACRYVEEALAWWEPRIEVLRVESTHRPEQDHTIPLVIAYRVRATHDERSLVFPFYTIPEES